MDYELKLNRYGRFTPTPELHSLEERAKNIVINTVNLAKYRVGIRQELNELAGKYIHLYLLHMNNR